LPLAAGFLGLAFLPFTKQIAITLIGTIKNANVKAGKILTPTAVLELIPNPPCGKSNRQY
jgi:hypothetical protein